MSEARSMRIPRRSSRPAMARLACATEITLSLIHISSEVNQLNRIKLMISVAKENMRAGKGFVMEPIATIRRDSVTSRMKPHHLTSDAEVERVAHRLSRGLHWKRASKGDAEE